MNSFQVELNHDYTNCYVDPQGSDIEDGRLTLLIVLALQRANPEQKKLLNANYGCEEPEKVEIVKQVCIFSNFSCMFLNPNNFFQFEF